MEGLASRLRFENAPAEENGASLLPQMAKEIMNFFSGGPHSKPAATDFEKDWSAANPDLTGLPLSEPLSTPVPEYRNPGKKWRLKQSSTPNWYKARHGMRTKALSGAARVARFRPRPLSSGKP